MSCNKCEQNDPCNKCCKVDSKDVCYTGIDLNCIDVFPRAQTVENYLIKIDEILCQLLALNFDYGILTLTTNGVDVGSFAALGAIDTSFIINVDNIGPGARVYKGLDTPSKTHEFRTINKNGDLITISEDVEEVVISIDEVALYDLFPVTEVQSVGAGVPVFNGMNGTIAEISALNSPNILLVKNPDGSITATAPDNSPFQYLTAYYINNNYAPTPEAPSDGSIIRPFVTFDEARNKMIGVIGTDLDYLGRPVSILHPKNRNVIFIMQTSSSTALNPSINTLRVALEGGSNLEYTGNDVYVFDSEVLYPLVLKDGLNEITESIFMEIGGLGQISRTTPGGYIRSIGAKRGASVTTNNPNKIEIFLNRIDEDLVTLIEYNNYSPVIHEGDVLNPDGITLVGDNYNPPIDLKWTTLLSPTTPLVYTKGRNFDSFSYPLASSGGLYIHTLVNTALHVEDTNISFNEFTVNSFDDLISVVQGDTFVLGFPGVYEPKNAPAIFAKNASFFINSLLFINTGTFGFHGWDTFFKIEGIFNLLGTINYDTNYYIKTFADLTDTLQDYFELNGKTNSANLKSKINYLINSDIVGDFEVRMPNTIVESVANLSENPSTNVIPVTGGTLSSINGNPVISGILNYADDVAASAVLPPNSLYFNTTNNALDIV